MKIKLALAVFVGVLALTACKKDEAPAQETATTQEVAKEAETAAAQVVEGDNAQAGETAPSAEPVAQDPNSAEAKAGEDQQY